MQASHCEGNPKPLRPGEPQCDARQAAEPRPPPTEAETAFSGKPEPSAQLESASPGKPASKEETFFEDLRSSGEDPHDPHDPRPATEAEAPQQAEEFDFERAMQSKQQGRDMFFQSKYLEASEKFEEALAFCPPAQVADRVKLQSNLSICMMKLGQYESAVGYCNGALELDEFWAKARYNRAESCFRLGRFDRALEDLKRTFAERPDLRDARMLQVGGWPKEYQAAFDEDFARKKQEALGSLKSFGNMLLGKFGLSTDNFKVHKKDDGSFNLQFQNDA